MTDSQKLPWLYTAMTLIGVALFGYATGVLMGPGAQVLGARLEETTCLQVAFSAKRFAAVLGSFSPGATGSC